MLRSVATAIEEHATPKTQTFVSVAEVITKNSPDNCLRQCSVSVDLRYIGRSHINLREYMVRDAGKQLGQSIAESLDYEFRNGFNDYYKRTPIESYETYTAKVYVYTQKQLHDLIAAAIKAGQQT